MTEGDFDCPHCGWRIYDYFDGSTQTETTCEHCKSELVVEEYTLEVNVHKVRVAEEKNEHL